MTPSAPTDPACDAAPAGSLAEGLVRDLRQILPPDQVARLFPQASYPSPAADPDADLDRYQPLSLTTEQCSNSIILKHPSLLVRGNGQRPTATNKQATLPYP